MDTMFYFGISNPDDAISRAVVDSNRRDLAFWNSLVPNDEDDLSTAINRINIRTAIPRKLIASSLFTLRFLSRLPRLTTLVDKLGHLDMTRLNAITAIGSKIPKDFLELFDSQVTDYLTPSKKAQVLPQPSAIAAMLRKFRAKLCPEEESTAATPSATLNFTRLKSGSVRVGVTLPADDAVVLRSALEQISKGKDCEPGTALLHLVEGLPTTVTMNVYGTKENPEYLQEGVWLCRRQIKFWKSRISKFRDMDAIEYAVTDAYSPTAAMRTFVKGRDTTCTVPDCNVDAKYCQIDHIIPFGNGGPTTPWNLQCLCPFHHGQKTDGRLQAYPLPNGDVLFLIDGIPALSTPEGPLSRSHRTWGTKYGDFMERKMAA